MTTYDLSGANRMLEATDAALTRIRTQLAGKIPAAGRDVNVAIDKHINAARSAIQAAINKSATIANDARVYPAGKLELIRRVVADTETTISEHVANAQALVDVLKADMTQAALPKMSDNRQAPVLARMDVQMILSQAPANRIHAVLASLAARNDDVGALVTSGWLDDVLLARGEDAKMTQAMRTLVTQSALDAASASGDPDRAAAADAIRHVGQLTGAAGGVIAAWNQAKDELSGDRAAARLHHLDTVRRMAQPIESSSASLSQGSAA